METPKSKSLDMFKFTHLDPEEFKSFKGSLVNPQSNTRRSSELRSLTKLAVLVERNVLRAALKRWTFMKNRSQHITSSHPLRKRQTEDLTKCDISMIDPLKEEYINDKGQLSRRSTMLENTLHIDDVD